MMDNKVNIKSIISALKDTIQITCSELRHVFKDSGVLIIFFGAGLFYPLIYGLTYFNEALHEVPITMVDYSHSALSRNFIRELDATPDVKVKYQSPSMEEAQLLYAQKNVYGIIYIPSSFSKDIQTGQQTHVSAYTSMASMLYYRAIYSAVNYVALDMGHKIQIKNLMAKGLTQRQAVVSASPIWFEGKSLYNPKAGYGSFLVPCILILVLQQTLVLGIGILAGTAREENTFHNLIPLQQKFHGTLRIVIGKSAAYFLLYCFVGAYNLLAIPHIFNLPQLVDFWTLSIFILPYLLACVFFAMSLSVFFGDREVVFLLYLFSSLPLLFMSGAMWPQGHLPVFWKTVSYFFPSTVGIQGFIKLNSMKATLADVSWEYVMLWVQTAVYFIFAFFVYRWQILSSEKRRIANK
ncbi:MAG: ABC transporter permease [Paludibacteraceae bacterium]|nr:ABC transporter permease [Paludibacteraceae bacterium]